MPTDRVKKTGNKDIRSIFVCGSRSIGIGRVLSQPLLSEASEELIGFLPSQREGSQRRLLQGTQLCLQPVEYIAPV